MDNLPKPVQTTGVTWNPDIPFNDLPPLPPAVELETRAVLKQCILARTALGELKQAALLIPNQSVLINTLPLLEAQSSSEIENIVTTTDKLFAYRADDEGADPATKEALRYSQALLEGFHSLASHPLTTRTAEMVCSKIKGGDMRVRSIPGTALARERKGGREVVYTPPVGEDRLRTMLANWERFLHEETDIDPLVRMAAGHYQFEAIHPFTDGNGRTGRVLNSLFLIHEGLLTLPILYHSRYIIENRADYYQLLLGVTRDNRWEDWLLYLIKGIQETAVWTREKIEAVRRLMDHTVEFVRTQRSKIYSYELLSLIFELPYCRIQNVVEAGIAKRQAASRYLKELTDIGVLEERSVGREKLFLHTKFLNLLIRVDDFSPYF
ncbi:MAG: Fic family protein [Planctomycetaceae bacterium]|nr:Fic family protein [Planctomycetaceae bacterium]